MKIHISTLATVLLLGQVALLTKTTSTSTIHADEADPVQGAVWDLTETFSNYGEWLVAYVGVHMFQGWRDLYTGPAQNGYETRLPMQRVVERVDACVK